MLNAIGTRSYRKFKSGNESPLAKRIGDRHLGRTNG